MLLTAQYGQISELPFLTEVANTAARNARCQVASVDATASTNGSAKLQSVLYIVAPKNQLLQMPGYDHDLVQAKTLRHQYDYTILDLVG